MDAADLLDLERPHVVDVALHDPLEAVVDAETSTPSRTARIVAAPITLLMPGGGPPADEDGEVLLLTHGWDPRGILAKRRIRRAGTPSRPARS